MEGLSQLPVKTRASHNRLQRDLGSFRVAVDEQLTPPFPKPAEDNAFLSWHIRLLRESYRHWTREDLVPYRMTDAEAARYLYGAPFALLSHDAAKDPVLNYGNEVAMGLFAVTWNELVSMPSRRTAAQSAQAERTAILEEVRAQGYTRNYRGVRIARGGRRFEIEEAVIWNVMDEVGVYVGQAALIKHWRFL